MGVREQSPENFYLMGKILLKTLFDRKTLTSI